MKQTYPMQMEETQALKRADEVLLLEQHAERAALSRVWGVNFTHVLKEQGIPPEITFTTEGSTKGRHQQAGESIPMRTWILRGTDLYDERVWKKFVASLTEQVELSNLSAYADPISRAYSSWLLQKHSGRSRLVQEKEHLAWVEQVASLVVLRRMMEAKYHLHLSGEQGFADPWVAGVMESLLFTALMTAETAKAVYRACREPSQAKSYIEAIAQRLEGFLLDRPQVLRSDLPRLPQHASLPHTLISAPSSSPSGLGTSQEERA